MFKNLITACVFTQKPEKNPTFEKFESMFKGIYSDRITDWVIIRTDNKILQFSEVSEHNWFETLEIWQRFALHFTWFRVEVKYDSLAKEIVIDMYDLDTSVCIIINFNV